MDVMILEPADGLEQLYPLFVEWQAAANGEEFAIPLDVAIAMNTARTLVQSPQSELLVAVDDAGVIHGFMGMVCRPSHVGRAYIAHECLFYVSARKRGSGVSLLRAFKRLAKERGCSHYILNASRLAGDADLSGRLFCALGAAPLETSFVGVL